MSTLQKKSKKQIDEIVWLRAVACLMIVAVHAVESVMFGASAEQASSGYRLLYPLMMFMKLATPLFIFISAFLLAYAYPIRTPDHFLSKRAKYLLLPYVLIAVVYALLDAAYAGFSASVLTERLWKNIFLAEFHGYFILTIFQFYIIHKWLAPYLNRWSAAKVLPAALVINAAYLLYFNLARPFSITHGETFWQFLWWVPFPSWIFYYAAAYYAGKNIDRFREGLNRNRLLLGGGTVVSVLVFFAIYMSKVLPVNSSKNVVVLIYAVPVTLLMFYITSRLRRRPPAWVNWTASLSFGIFLLHMLCQKIVYHGIQSGVPELPLYAQIVILFAAGVAGSMLLTYILNLLPLGSWFIGQVKLPGRSKTPVPPATVPVSPQMGND